MYFIEKIKAREQNLQNCPKILKGGVRKHKVNLKITHLRSHSSWNNAWIKIACSAKNLIGRIIALLLCPNISSLKVMIIQLQLRSFPWQKIFLQLLQPYARKHKMIFQLFRPNFWKRPLFNFSSLSGHPVLRVMLLILSPQHYCSCHHHYAFKFIFKSNEFFSPFLLWGTLMEIRPFRSFSRLSLSSGIYLYCTSVYILVYFELYTSLYYHYGFLTNMCTIFNHYWWQITLEAHNLEMFQVKSMIFVEVRLWCEVTCFEINSKPDCI